MDELWDASDYYDPFPDGDSDSNSSDNNRISGVDGDTDAPDGLMQLDSVKTEENQTLQSQHVEVNPRTLLETCARFIGQNIPFELVQLHPQRVPEEVQKRIAYWSFPLEEKRLLEYAKMMEVSEHTISRVERVLNSKNNNERRRHRDEVYYGPVNFNKPIQDHVKMTQIGMHLTGTMEDLDRMYYSSGHHSTSNPVSMCVQFDRGCITSTMCSCRSSSKWCEHVIVLCIARIRGIIPCEIHPPMSEILSHFNRDQFQKLIQHFLEKIPLVGITPVLEIAYQLKDEKSEVNKQCGAPDLTAGGCVSEVARWQIDDSIITARLDKEWQSLDNSTNAGIHNFKDFTMFLQNHDGNVVTAFKWFLETIKLLHEHLSMFGHVEGQDGSYYHFPTNQLSPTAKRYPFYLVLMQGLQICFADLFISKGCKEEIADLLKSQDAFTRSEPLTEQYTSLLQEAVAISEASPRPTLHYIQNLKLTLQGEIESTDRDCGEGSSDSRILFSCLVAVLRYWLFHKYPCNPDNSAVASNVCKWVFPAMHSVSSTFEDLVTVNKCLEDIQVSCLLRHGQVLMEYLIHSGVDQQEIVEFVTKLPGASSVEMSAIIQSASEDTLILITHVEEAILCLAKQHISFECKSFTPVLHQKVKECLHRDVGEGVFIWPWSLLRLAALDPVMVEEVREVTQNFIGNANSILHCTGQTDQVYPPHVVDLVRDSLLSLLQHLFNTLQPDSAQVLFTTLSNAFPFPIAYSAGCLLSKELQDFLCNIIYRIPELQKLMKGRKFGVLPNLQCDPLLLHLVQQDGRFVGTNEAIQNILLKAVNAMFSIDRKHVEFIEKLIKLTKINTLLFQLRVLYSCVYNSMKGLYGRVHISNQFTILDINYDLQLDTPGGYKAFLYLVDKWQYCLHPSDVLTLIVYRYCTNLVTNGTTGRDEEVAHLISTVVLADKNALRSMEYPPNFESLFRILGQSEDVECLFVVVDAFDIRSDVVELELVGRAFGRQYSRLKARTEGTISDNTILFRLKTKCMAILEKMISKECGHHMQQYADVFTSVTACEWAPIVCAIGEDAIKKFLTVLQRSHKVNSLGKFPYSFCQVLGNLWSEYSATLPSGSLGILSVPAFEKITTKLLPEKEKNARNTITRCGNNTKRVKEAMLLLASIYQPLQLEKEFKTFASKMFSWCGKNVRDMIVREFIRTPLSAIKIPTAMLERLSQLDKQGTARHQVDKQEKYSPQEMYELSNPRMMRQYYAIGRGGQSKRMKI